ncbi:MAG: Kdo hydroxylase family protein [Phycisphaerae bacterium]
MFRLRPLARSYRYPPLCMDNHYPKTTLQTSFCFPAPRTWICFTNQVRHAVDAGQYLLEQTYLLLVGAMQNPAPSPLRVLKGLLGTRLVPDR